MGTTDRPGAGAARRVVVVGAGLAGLTAALDLRDAGWDVVVLEARDRVGGRVWTRSDGLSPGLHAEAGGESIDDDHTAMQAMITRFGLRTERRPPDREVAAVVYRDGRAVRATQYAATDGGKVGREIVGFAAGLESFAEGVDPEHPQRSARAEKLDAMSLGQYLQDAALTPEAAFVIANEYRSEYNADSSDLSMLFIAQQSLVGGATSGVEAMRVAGGNSQLPEAMAGALGTIVQTGRPVDRIAYGQDSVSVTAGDLEVHGSWLVLAAPLMPMRQITFDPPLPTAVRALVDGLDLGAATKVVAEYDDAFWRRDGRSGVSLADLTYSVSWDPIDSWAQAAPGGLLTAFTTGSPARELSRLDDPARIDQVRRQLDEVFPDGAAHRRDGAFTVSWVNQQYTGGGYAFYRPGQVIPFWPVLREGFGRVRFAGEHTEVLAGYMESAVRSGHRVAAGIGTPPP